MTKFIGIIVAILIIVVIPALIITLIVRAIKKKPLKKVLMVLKISGISLIPLVILGVITDPNTWCKHEYSITSEVKSTCTEQGKIVYKCEKCEREKTDRIDRIEHDMQVVENGKRCSVCGYEDIVKEETISVDDSVNVDANTTETEVMPEEVVEIARWKTAFKEKGFSEEEIAEYEEILTTVGITDFHDVDIIENGRMHIVRGKIFDSNVLQLNITLEEHSVIVVELAGIPDTDKEAYINWRGKLKFRTVNTKKSIDLYYDVDGGYVAKLDWENKLITPFEE